jgi:hypothetical protein
MRLKSSAVFLLCVEGSLKLLYEKLKTQNLSAKSLNFSGSGCGGDASCRDWNSARG